MLQVEFEASDGTGWSSIGGGDSIEGAIAFARESLPLDRHWRVVRLSDLYGA